MTEQQYTVTVTEKQIVAIGAAADCMIKKFGLDAPNQGYHDLLADEIKAFLKSATAAVNAAHQEATSDEE